MNKNLLTSIESDYEIFDWLSSNMEKTEEMIEDIQDLEFLEILEDIETDAQDRESVRKMACKRRKRIKFELYGFDLNVLDRLLNHVPFYSEDRVKEPISKEMRAFIFERDEYTCRLCYDSWHNVVCHHIDVQGNANEENLITLCNKCHLSIHRLLRNKGYRHYVPERNYRWRT